MHFLKFKKRTFFCKIFEEPGIFDSQTVDKTENAKSNEIKILVLPPESLKSQKTVSVDNLGQKLLKILELHKFSSLLSTKKCLIFRKKMPKRKSSNLDQRACLIGC